MSILKKYFDRTVRLIDVLQQEMDRDSKIQQVEVLLLEREAIMKQMAPPFTKEEEELGKKLLTYEQTINQLLIKEKKCIQNDMKNISLKKESTKKYVNPYASLSTDGIFYDKRK